MKNNWTIRIIIFTVLCFGLATFFGKIAGEDKFESYFQNVADELSNNGKFVSVYNKESFAAFNLKEIDIVTEAIDLKVEKSKDEKIHLFYYKKNDEVASDLISYEDSVAKIKLDKLIFPKHKLKFNFNIKNLDNLGVTAHDVNESVVIIQVPIQIEKIKIKTVSGEIKILDLKLAEVQTDSISGNIQLQGSFDSIKSKTVSGDFKLISDIANPEIKFSTVSGDSSLIFLKDPDVSIAFKSVSGEIKIWGGLPATEIDGEIKGFKLGKGTARLNFETTSGDVKISAETN